MQKPHHSLKPVCIAENRLCRQNVSDRRNSVRINAVIPGGLHIPSTADLKNYIVIYANIVALLFKVTVQKASIVPLSALPMQDARRTEYDKRTL